MLIPSMDEQTADNSGVRVFPPAIYAAGVAIGLALDWLLPARLVPARHLATMRIVGAALIGAWLVLAIWALATFRRAGTTPNPTQPTTALAFGGPYRFTRNPMYVSMALMTIGVAMVANTWWPIVVLPPVLLMVQRAVIEREERYLEAKFGQEYLRYKTRVRRWV